jgi:hypothetical protein
VPKQRLLGRDRYPLVPMLEPLFHCNIPWAGSGKIDYRTPILKRRLNECLDTAGECGAPIVQVPGDEPLISVAAMTRIYAGTRRTATLRGGRAGVLAPDNLDPAGYRRLAVVSGTTGRGSGKASRSRAAGAKSKRVRFVPGAGLD